jgi:glutathione S-transferase
VNPALDMAASEPSKVILWDHPVSSYAQKVRIALREKGIPFESRVQSDLGVAKYDASSDFYKDNPRREVPVLVDGSAGAIFDSTIIMEYLEDRYAENPLISKDPADRAEQRLIEDVLDTQYEAVNWTIGELQWFGRAETTGEPKLKDEMMERLKQQTKDLQAWLEEKLAGKDWFGFGGQKFGWGDVAAAPIVNRSVHYGLGPAEGSKLKAWHRRLLELPSVKETFAEFDAAVGGMAKAKDAFLGGQRIREYRDHRLECMIKSGGLKIVQKGMEDNNIRFSWPEW